MFMMYHYGINRYLDDDVFFLKEHVDVRSGIPYRRKSLLETANSALFHSLLYGRLDMDGWNFENTGSHILNAVTQSY